jgi:hypothetical protein
LRPAPARRRPHRRRRSGAPASDVSPRPAQSAGLALAITGPGRERRGSAGARQHRAVPDPAATVPVRPRAAPAPYVRASREVRKHLRDLRLNQPTTRPPN